MAVMLLEWVVTSAFLILVVLALRAALGKRVSARLRYALWAVVLLRLLVPVQLFTSPLAGTWVVSETSTERNWYTVPAPSANLAEPVVNLPETGVIPGALPTIPNAPTLPDAPDPPSAPDLTKAPVWLGWGWLAGSGLVALVLLLSNLRFFWKLRRARIPLEGADCPLRVYAAVGLPSPCLFGLVRPAIYVTPEAAADPAMLRHVTAHEYTHYRHGDHIWSLLRCAALAAHWWNPLVWLAAVLSRRDAELACDEGALKRLGDGERAAYGNTLLALVTAKPGPVELFRCATTMAGDKKSLKERISRIARAPKRWLWAAVAVVLVTALACVCAFGQKAPAEAGEGSDDFVPVWPYGVSEMTYVRDAGGFGGDFAITLRHDGSFTYYEGLLSSYIGMGSWGRMGDVIRLADEGLKDSAGIQYYYFRLDSGGLVFQAENSAKFMYVDVADGERFSRRTDESDEPRFSINENGTVLVEGMEGSHVEWHGPDTSPSRGWLYFTNPSFCCPSLAGKEAEGSALWTDESRTAVGVVMNVNDERVEDGTVDGFYIHFVVELDSGKVLERVFDSQIEGETLELTDQKMVDMARALAKLLTAAEEYYYNSAAQAPSELTADLNRNGVPEELRVSGTGEKMVLEVWEGDSLLYSEEGYFAHAGYNALFLCTLDGEDYLLRYHPTMYQGYCTYNYQLFTLENGRETVAREHSVEFDINFGPLMHLSFEPETIAAFVDEINGLLTQSTQLLNTDSDLLGTFEEEGRLYDSVWWLDGWEPVFARDPSKSLLENLTDFQQAMEQQRAAETPVVSNPSEVPYSGLEPRRDLLLTYQGRTKWFSADWEQFYPDDTADGQLIDLDGDGNMEIVVSLVWGHGTGCYGEHLYIFDAETLEQYDTSGLEDMILSQVTSYADEERFYVSAPGLEAEIEKPDGDYYYYNDSVSFGDYYRYQVRNGRLYGRFGAALDRADVCYCGTLEVELRLDGGKLVCAGFEYQTEPVDN